MSKLLIATTTFNEEDSIVALLNGISRFAPDADILVVDDSSSDKTCKLIKHFDPQGEKVTVVVRPTKLGVGSAHLFAMLYSIKHEYDSLITLDADLSHSPHHLPEFIENLQTSDFVIGSRYVNGGQCNYKLFRYTLSKVANTLVRVLLRVPLYETTTSYRGFSTALLRQILNTQRLPEGYAFFFDITHRVCKFTYSIKEIPITFEDRRFGSTKISKLEVFRAILHLIKISLSKLVKSAKSESSIFVGNNEEARCPSCNSEKTIQRYPPAAQEKFHIKSSDSYACNTLSHKSRGGIVDCTFCGNSFLFPQPSSKDLHKNYSNVVDHTYIENFPARLKTFKYNWEQIKHLGPKNGTLLDIGCYCGAFAQIAIDDGYIVEGLEPSVWATEYCRRTLTIPVHCGTADILPLGEKKFDIITAWDVLEHVTNPLDFLRNVHTSLNPEGIFFFSTLNTDNWFPKLTGKNWPWYIDMHLSYFREKTLSPMLAACGFKVIEMRPYCHIITISYLLKKLRALNIPGISKMQPFVENHLPHLMIPFRFGDIVLVSCRKEKSSLSQQNIYEGIK